MSGTFLQTLGLAMCARELATGEELVLQEVRSGKAHLVIIAEDASENTRKKMQAKCSSYNTPLLAYGSRQELGHAIGKDERVTIAVLSKGFAKLLSSLAN